MSIKVHQLLCLDATQAAQAEREHAPLACARPWLAAFTDAGEAIGAAAYHGKLERGVRDVLAHHIIFHWNRLGLPATAQAVLAHAATETILTREHDHRYEIPSNVAGA
jgi:thiopeptide-type bacteriocin biosynthesis protein